MAELAFNLNGERFDVPSIAAWWRVRRLRDVPRGGPEVVFARDGLPLVISIDAGIDELRRCVDDVPGKYRLDPIDERHQPVPDVQAAYIQIAKPVERNVSAPPVTAIELSKVDPRDELLRDVVRVNADVTKTMADRFAGVMEAAAILLRAADGAGLPARPGMVVDARDAADSDDDDDDGDDAARQPLDVVALIGQVMPLLCAFAASRGLDLSKVGTMFGQAAGAKKLAKDATSKSKSDNDDASGERSRSPARRLAEPQRDRAAPMQPGTDADSTGEDATGASPEPRVDDAMARLLAIQAALKPGEHAFVQRVMSDLSAGELAAWRTQLCQGSVDDAVQLIRAEIARAKELVKTKEEVS